MNRRQREERHARRVAHVRQQRKERETAIAQAEKAAVHMSQDGRKPLKKPRTDETLIAKIFKDTMQRHGFVPNGRGGWRKLHVSKPPKRNPLDRPS